MEPELLELAGDDPIATPTYSDQAIDITGPQTPVLPKEVVEERAHKANLGLGTDSPGTDVLAAAIERGDEHIVRQDSANTLVLKEYDNRRTMLRELASSQVPGAPISQDDQDLVAGLQIAPVVDPATVWEKQYGTFLTNRLVMNTDDPNGAVNKGLIEDPIGNYGKLDIARDLITKNEVVNKREAEANAAWKELGTWDTITTFGGTLIPGRSNLNITNTDLFSTGAVAAIALPGRTLGEQVQALVSIPNPDVFAAKFNETVDRLMSTNVLDAMDFIKAVKSFSIEDQFIRNSFGLMDVADVGALTTAIVKGGMRLGGKIAGKAVTSAEMETTKAIVDTVRATAGPQTPATVAARIGMTNEAAALKIISKNTGEVVQIASEAPTKHINVLLDQMPTISRPTVIRSAEAALPNSQATRIAAVLENNAAKFMDNLGTALTPERLTPEALNLAIENAKTELKKGFAHVNDAVLDVVDNGRDPFTNTNSVSVRLGKPDGETFTSSAEAELFARDIFQLGDGGYTSGQQGSAFYVDIAKPITETLPSVRELMVTTANQSSVPNIATALIQGVRTPAELFSTLQKANRDAALMANTNFGNFLSEVAKPIGALSKNQRKDLQRVMVQNRDFIDPVDGSRGRYHETIGDLESGYLDTLNRLPSEKEVEAYFTAVQINEMDWALRNFTAYRDLSRQGIEDFSVRVVYGGYSEYGAPKWKSTPKFKGKEVDGIPWANDEMLPVAVMDEHGTGVSMVYRVSAQEQRDMIADMVKNKGYKIIQVARPQERVLKDSANIREPVQYIVTKNHEKTPLSFHQVDRQPGFHVEYADPFYIKQPRVSVIQGGARAYEGDASLWSFQTKAQASKFEQRVNDLRQAIKNGVEDLDPYVTGKLPENAQWWRNQFGEDGHFSLDEKFHVVARGSSTRDSDKAIKELRDLTDDRTTLTASMDQKFQGERSQQLLSPVEGTAENPVIRLRPAPLIDPLSTTSRGVGQAARSRWFGDMKISVAEQFVQEFGDLLEGDARTLARNPLASFHEAQWRKGADKDVQRFAAAKALHKTTLEFMGQQSPFGKQLAAMEEKVMDSIYNKTGQNTAEKLRTTQDFVNSRDPMSYFRAWAFRAKMGFLNPQQLLVQAQGLAHITALAPQHAMQAMSGATYSRYLLLNSSKEIMGGAEQRVAGMGWKAGQFEESHRLMESTGWHNVGKEATYIDDMSDPKLYEGHTGKWLDKSAIFFTESEKMVRMASWHAAYREWRTANPTKTVANRDITNILSRADTMSLNMTNASKASWERGVLSIPAQFQSYGVRMLEQMTGSQLSLAEKARVLGLNSVLYGVPVGLSGIVGYPLYEDVRTYALEKGLNVNEGFIGSMLEGIPAVITAMLSGKELNVGQRYGPGGISLIKDLMGDEKSFAESMLGPSGSVYKDLFFNAAPAGMVAIAKALTGEAYEPEVQDLIDGARAITTVNAIDRVWMAATVGKYISKKGTVLSDTTTTDAIINAITGLQSREFSDAMLMNKSTKDFEEHKREISKEVQKHIGRSLIEAQNGNKEAAEAYMVKARAAVILGDFTPMELTQLFTQSIRGKNSTLVDKFRRDWITKAPPSRRMERAEQMERNR